MMLCYDGFWLFFFFFFCKYVFVLFCVVLGSKIIKKCVSGTGVGTDIP